MNFRLLFAILFSVVALGTTCTIAQPQMDSVLTVFKNAEGKQKVDALLWLLKEEYPVSDSIVKSTALEARKTGDKILIGKSYFSQSLAAFHRRNFQAVITLADSSLRYLNPDNDKENSAQLFYYKGTANWYLHNSEEALKYLNQALKLFVEVNNPFMEGLAWDKIGGINTGWGDLKNALLSFLKGKEAFARAHAMHKYAANNIDNCGVIYFRLGDYPKALTLYLESLRMCEAIGDVPGEANVLSNIGQVLAQQEKYNDALVYFDKGLVSARKAGDRRIIAELLMHLGNMYKILNNYDRSLMNLKQAISVNEKDNLNGLALNYKALGNLYFDYGHYKEALAAYKSGLDVSVISEQNRLVAGAYINLGKVRFALHDVAGARLLIEKGLGMVHDFDEKDLVIEGSALLTKIYQAMGDCDNALKYYTQYTVVKDSVFSQTKTKEIYRILMNHEIEISARENELLKKENQLNQQTIQKQNSQKYQLGISIICLVIVAAVISIGFYQKQKANHKLRSQYDIITEQSAEIQTKNKSLQQALEDLKRSNSQLIQSEKMASLGMLTAGIAHEINNPVNFISGGVQALEESFKDLRRRPMTNDGGPSQTWFVDTTSLFNIIKTGIERTVNIVSGLKSFAHTDNKKVYDVDIIEGIESTLTILGSKLKQGIQIQKNYSEIPKVYGNPGQINQVLLNIIDNAIYAIEEMNVKGAIIITVVADENYVTVSIRDNGKGIREDNKHNIFNPFFTTKEIGKGTGLGLYLSYNILQEHDGSLSFESREGVGTEFFIRLPIAKAKSNYADNS